MLNKTTIVTRLKSMLGLTMLSAVIYSFYLMTARAVLLLLLFNFDFIFFCSFYFSLHYIGICMSMCKLFPSGAHYQCTTSLTIIKDFSMRINCFNYCEASSVL